MIVTMTARGVVLRRLRTSSPSVAIRDYPVYAKKRIAAGSRMPAASAGAKGRRFDASNAVPATSADCGYSAAS